MNDMLLSLSSQGVVSKNDKQPDDVTKADLKDQL